METAISTVFERKRKHFVRDEAYDILRPVVDAGITHIQWAFDWTGEYNYSADEISDAKRVLNELGLRVKGIHGAHGWLSTKVDGAKKYNYMEPGQADIASFDEDLRKRGSALVHNRILLADAIGAGHIVLHCQPPYGYFGDEAYHEKHYEQIFKTLDENERLARETGVRICVENQSGTPTEYLTDEFDRIFSRYDPAYIGYCCDIGHLNITSAEDIFYIPRRYANRLHSIHLNDNHGLRRKGDLVTLNKDDEHYIMGDVGIDFDTFATVIAKSCYELPVLGEFVPHDEELGSFMRRARERMEAFTEKVVALRNAD